MVQWAQRFWWMRRWLDHWRQRDSEYANLFQRPQDASCVAIDCETTGLDPATAELVSIAAVEIDGNRVLRSSALHIRLLAPESLSAESIRIHRMRPVDLSSGDEVHEALRQLLAFVGNRPLVGWCLAFDIAMINRYLVPQFGFALPNRRVELAQLYQRHLRRTKPDLAPDMRFEAMADALQVPVAERHSALGDAVMSALMYVRLQRQIQGE